MKFTTKAERKELRRSYIEERDKVFKSVAKQAVKEYGKIGAGVIDELGYLFTGVRSTTPRKRR